MRYQWVTDIVRLAIRLQGEQGGLTLDDIGEEFSFSRGTAKRLRDAVETAFGPLQMLDTCEVAHLVWLTSVVDASHTSRDCLSEGSLHLRPARLVVDLGSLRILVPEELLKQVVPVQPERENEENLLGLMALNRELVGQAEAFDDSERVVLDMDSTESPVHGQQEGSAYNGHFESVCYHPLLLFNQHGDCLAAKLRPGNVHSAEDWNELLLPEIERQQAAGKQVTFRGDAAFAKPEIYESSEERGVQYAIRIPANRSLELEIEDILFRPPGRPGRKPLVRYKSFRYQAESWKKPRRVVAKVEHHQGELFPRVGFIVTNMSLPSRSVVRF